MTRWGSTWMIPRVVDEDVDVAEAVGGGAHDTAAANLFRAGLHWRQQRINLARTSSPPSEPRVDPIVVRDPRQWHTGYQSTGRIGSTARPVSAIQRPVRRKRGVEHANNS